MKGRLVALLCALLLTLSGCAPRPDPALAALAPDESRRLIVYTSHKEEVYAPIVKEFEERTGIWVEVVTGGTGELLDRIETEAESPRCDVMFGGGVESLLSYVNLFEPYTCADADLLKPGLRREGDPWTPFSSLPVVLIYNTRLVAPGELTGWADLLEEKWKGKIAFADPAVSGSSYTAAATMLTALEGEDWALLERFVRNLDGNILSGSGEVVTAVAGGSRYVGVTLEETALKRQAQGANIGIVYPAEGTSDLPDGTSLIAGAPHPENAKAFLEFTQSVDVQTLVAGDLARRPVRVDVAGRDALPDGGELAVVEYDIARASALKGEFLRRWGELTGEVRP